MSVVVKIEKFEGPLDLLLQLVEAEDLQINEISLVEVADQYLRKMREAAINPEELADFLVVAAKLLLIKSRTLLPDLASDLDEGPSLADQLRMYKEFVEASQKIDALFRARHVMFAREKAPMIPTFSPPKTLTAARLKDVFIDVIRAIAPVIELPKKALARAISIHDKIKEIRDTVLRGLETSFRRMVSAAKDKTEVIVSFLALLELVRTKVVDAEQRNLFEDITIKKAA